MKSRVELLLVALWLGVACNLSMAGSNDRPVVPGIEVLIEEQLHLIQGKRVGLITNHTGVDRRLQQNVDRLNALPAIRVTTLFSPEHGLGGTAQAGDKIPSHNDPERSIPIFSLYGQVRKPTSEMLKEVDVLVYDIQDAGSRFYTYIATLGRCMEAAAEQQIPFIVLDRPDPLTGLNVEGRVLDLRFRSFLGDFAIPIRYGLTPGELAGLINDRSEAKVQLTVVKMRNWRRHQWYDQTGMIWVPPSPNLPTLESTVVYPGMCLLEGTNLSEGRGTTRPFEMMGAPWIDGAKLARELTSLNLPGVLFRPVSFTPTFSKFSGQVCAGVQLHVVNRDVFRPVLTALQVISNVRHSYPSRFRWDQHHFDRLMGSDDVRLAIERKLGVGKIVDSWSKELKRFEDQRKRYFLYE